MKTIIIYKSIHHKNTEKVARVMADALGAKLMQPEEAGLSLFADYDLIGFGSGIYRGKHHKALLDLARALPSQDKLAFVFSTCGGQKNKGHKELLEILLEKGFRIKGEFSCNGFITWGLLRFVGGLRKGHPNEKDLEEARAFANKLMN
jgi:flavodoxin